MGITRQELLSRVNSKELTQWHIYHNDVCPIGGQGADLRNALLCSVVASSFCGKKFKIDDFLLSRKVKRRKPQSDEQIVALLKSYTNMFNREK